MATKILIIDDEKAITDMLEKFLQKEGYTPVAANSAKEGLKKLKKEKPDIILLDIRMPKMDGMEAMARIREIDPEVAVIMATAVIDEDIAKKALGMNATDYIVKPFDLDYLKKVLLVKIASLME